MRLVQLETSETTRRVACVEGRRLRLLATSKSVYELALAAMETGSSLADTVARELSNQFEDYDRVLAEQRLLTPLDHPDPAHVLVSGTGLTHLGSASTRAGMHDAEARPAAQTDSMKLFQLGVERGKPADGSVGVQPEWFARATAAA